MSWDCEAAAGADVSTHDALVPLSAPTEDGPSKAASAGAADAEELVGAGEDFGAEGAGADRSLLYSRSNGLHTDTKSIDDGDALNRCAKHCVRYGTNVSAIIYAAIQSKPAGSSGVFLNTAQTLQNSKYCRSLSLFIISSPRTERIIATMRLRVSCTEMERGFWRVMGAIFLPKDICHVLNAGLEAGTYHRLLRASRKAFVSSASGG